MTSTTFLILGSGMMAAFNPCGIAMLPSYLAYLLGGEKSKVKDGLWAGLLMTGGFLLTFLVAGIFSMMFAEVLGKMASWIAFMIGIFFVIAGIFMLFGKNLFAFHIGGNWELEKGARTSLFVYGIAYALGSLGCTLPLFSILVLSSFHAQGFMNGILHFLLYAFGMGFVVTLLSLASTISQQIVVGIVRSSARWMGKLSGLITLATGIYLMVYWIPYLSLK
jgi:cytochrome c-type biogenesis protein